MCFGWCFVPHIEWHRLPQTIPEGWYSIIDVCCHADRNPAFGIRIL